MSTWNFILLRFSLFSSVWKILWQICVITFHFFPTKEGFHVLRVHDTLKKDDVQGFMKIRM